MSAIYDNWERLVAIALKKQQLWELFHAPSSRTSSTLSEASDFSSSSRRHDQDSWWQEEPPKLIIFPDFIPAFAVEDVRMTPAVLIGKGTFGNSYSATMNNGVRIVVKRLELGNVSELDCKRGMDVIGRVRHVNVAPLRGYYASHDERVLLYDYYQEGSVYALLHGQTGKDRARVSWGSRAEIALCVAKAVAEIHKRNGGKLVHGNIKASNVLLSATVCCCVSDLGLANMIETTFVSSARCYAPEVKTGKDVSQASDVYSFGVLLLELLTRKSSVHVPGGPEAIDLVKLVRSKRASKVVDPDLWHDSTIRDDRLVKMLEIGIRCVSKSVKKRPQMSEVVQMLEDTSEIIPFNPTPVAQKKLVFLEDNCPKFGLEEVFRAEAMPLGRGTFGASYKAILENGITVAVKRLRNVVVTENGFREHMEVYGKMKHKNVANAMAYYFSRDEKLVLCHYFGEISVSALLHGPRGYERKLDWKTRLKIAMDVGMAIAHIHGEDGRKLVHGNVKSSNVFFVDEKYAILADAGYAKVTNPVKLSSFGALEYHAPEVKDTWQVSQASDVYSFGVFLVELASDLFSSDIKHLDSDKWIDLVLGEGVLRYQISEAMMPGIVEFLQMGKRCVNPDPQHRPGMPQVVKMLEGIPGMPLEDINENVASVKSRQEDDVEGEEWPLSSIETRLENLLLYMLPTMSR